MKLTVEIDLPEEEIQAAIRGIPKYFLKPGYSARSTIAAIAVALAKAYYEAKGGGK